MTFKQALRELDIEDYSERIKASNRTKDYVTIAENLRYPEWFRKWFEATVKLAEEKWDHPDDVFQNILRLLKEGGDPDKNKSRFMTISVP